MTNATTYHYALIAINPCLEQTLTQKSTHQHTMHQPLKHKRHLRTLPRDFDNPMHENACAKMHLKMSSLYPHPSTQPKQECPYGLSFNLWAQLVTGYIDHIWNTP